MSAITDALNAYNIAQAASSDKANQLAVSEQAVETAQAALTSAQTTFTDAQTTLATAETDFTAAQAAEAAAAQALLDAVTTAEPLPTTPTG